MLKELGIIQVTIDLPFRLNHVNCFLGEGENGWTVMDAGLHNNTAKQAWKEALHGKKVDTIFISHYHPDHFGYAGGLQEKTGATLWMTKTDEASGKKVWENEFLDNLVTNYRLCGTPEELSEQMSHNTGDFKKLVTPYPNVQHYFKEGMNVPFGKYEYEVYETPGHSEGMIVLYNKERNVLFSTDHVLPRITPNISYWFHGNPDPLGQFFDSLEKIRRLEAEFVLPSHGKAFYDANKRIDEIVSHHDKRLDEVMEALREPATVYDVCETLFNRPLTIHETRFALGESLAHLQYLHFKGECKKTETDGVLIFERN